MMMINIVQSCGFTVLVIFADNNVVNRKVFKDPLKSDDTCFDNPSGKGKMYVIYDSVHLLKCVEKLGKPEIYRPNIYFPFY
jgi:hypothetical protein